VVGKWLRVPGVVSTGYGVASGAGGSGPGTVGAQIPHFTALGLDLSSCFAGTINVSIAPRQWAMIAARHTFEEVAWSPDVPAETFSFSPCRITTADEEVEGYVYYPHPETKPDHFHPPTVIEVIAPFIKTIAPGTPVQLLLNPAEVEISD